MLGSLLEHPHKLHEPCTWCTGLYNGSSLISPFIREMLLSVPILFKPLYSCHDWNILVSYFSQNAWIYIVTSSLGTIVRMFGTASLVTIVRIFGSILVHPR